MIFVDTSAWYAAYVPTDPQHAAVSAVIQSQSRSVITSDFIVDETITLLLARGERTRAANFARDVLITGIVPLEFVSLADLVGAYHVLLQYHDKKWSYTDCTSFVVMQRRGIGQVISLDQDFRQMPGIAVYP
jgi:predicted nucleic acid-binding protein